MENDNVQALFSPFNSVLTLAAQQYLNKSNSNIPMVFAGGAAGNLFTTYQNAFGMVKKKKKKSVLLCFDFVSYICVQDSSCKQISTRMRESLCSKFENRCIRWWSSISFSHTLIADICQKSINKETFSRRYKRTCGWMLLPRSVCKW